MAVSPAAAAAAAVATAITPINPTNSLASAAAPLHSTYHQTTPNRCWSARPFCWAWAPCPSFTRDVRCIHICLVCRHSRRRAVHSKAPSTLCLSSHLHTHTNKHTTTDKAGHDLFSSEKPEAIERMQEEQKRQRLTKVG